MADVIDLTPTAQTNKHEKSYVERVMGLGSTFMIDLEHNPQQLNRAVVYEMLNCVDMAIKNGVTYEKVVEAITEEMSKHGVKYVPEHDPFGRVLKDLFTLNLGESGKTTTDEDYRTDMDFKEEVGAAIKTFSKILWIEKVIWLVRVADDSHKLNVAEIFEHDISAAAVLARAARSVMKITIEDVIARYCVASSQTGEQALARPAIQRMVQVWTEPVQ